MKQIIEQWYVIKFCVKLNKLSTKRFFMLQEDYGKGSLSKSQMFRCNKAFEAGK